MTAASTSQPLRAALRGSPARRRRERTVRAILLVSALLSIVISLFIVGTVLFEALEFLGKIDLGDLVGIGWFPRRGIFDVATILLGTLIVTIVAMLIATPIGLASAIYLAEYASPRTRRIVKPDPRDPRRHPERGHRVLRPDLHHADHHPADVHERVGVQPPGRGHRGRAS